MDARSEGAKPVHGIVLAAGEGRRNRPLTHGRSKVMLPVANRPILDHVLAALREAGVLDVVLVVGYKAEAIQSYFQDGSGLGLRIRYEHQPSRLGTADAFARGLRHAEDASEVLLVPGDNYLGRGVLKGFLESAGEHDALLYTQTDDPDRYGVLQLTDDLVADIKEKPRRPGNNLISTGIVKLDTKTALGVKRHVKNIETGLTEFLDERARSTRRLHAVPLEGAWFDVDRPENLLGANALHLAEEKGTVSGVIEPGASLVGEVRIGRGSRVRSGSYMVGPIVVGEGCEIGPNAVLYGPTAIGDNVTIGPFTELLECVVMQECRIASGCTLHHAVLDRGVTLAPRVSIDRAHAVEGPGFGAIVGDGTVLGNNVVLQPGSTVGVDSRVAPQKTVGTLPDFSKVV